GVSPTIGLALVLLQRVRQLAFITLSLTLVALGRTPRQASPHGSYYKNSPAKHHGHARRRRKERQETATVGLQRRAFRSRQPARPSRAGEVRWRSRPAAGQAARAPFRPRSGP